MRKFIALLLTCLVLSYENVDAISILDVNIEIASYHDQIQLDQKVEVYSFNKSLSARITDYNIGDEFDKSNGTPVYLYLDNNTINSRDEHYNDWYFQTLSAQIHLTAAEYDPFTSALVEYTNRSNMKFTEVDFPGTGIIPVRQDMGNMTIDYSIIDANHRAKVSIDIQQAVFDSTGVRLDMDESWAEMIISKDGLTFININGMSYNKYNNNIVVSTNLSSYGGFNINDEVTYYEAIFIASSIEVIPEPSSFWLIGAGLVGIWLVAINKYCNIKLRVNCKA